MCSSLLKFFFFFLSFLYSDNYNVPFIDTAETLNLQVGMNKSQVIYIMKQKPLYVEYGNKDTGEIFWVYEVRGREVASKYTFEGEKYIVKNNNIQRFSQPLHHLRLEFREDKLYRWQIILTTKKTDNSSSRKMKKFGNLFFEFGIGTTSSNINANAQIEMEDGTEYNFQCDKCYSYTTFPINLFIGVNTIKGKTGLEVIGRLGEGGGVFLKRELMNYLPYGINLLFGIGVQAIEIDRDETINWNQFAQINSTDTIEGYSSYTQLQSFQNSYNNSVEVNRIKSWIDGHATSVIKLGVGKHFNKLNMRYELGIGSNIMHSLLINYQII
tara:strand:+ start:660 stop:1637 length:978 start_codon:yes stop_codon:yes gene_type:complete